MIVRKSYQMTEMATAYSRISGSQFITVTTQGSYVATACNSV